LAQKTEAKPALLRLTKYEKARIIGGRALQIALNLDAPGSNVRSL
jgi:DNA-directed RNA polymerase subunit K/omega